MFAEKNPFIFFSDSDKIFNKLDLLEDRILFSSEHQSYKIILLM